MYVMKHNNYYHILFAAWIGINIGMDAYGKGVEGRVQRWGRRGWRPQLYLLNQYSKRMRNLNERANDRMNDHCQQKSHFIRINIQLLLKCGIYFNLTIYYFLRSYSFFSFCSTPHFIQTYGYNISISIEIRFPMKCPAAYNQWIIIIIRIYLNMHLNCVCVCLHNKVEKRLIS